MKLQQQKATANNSPCIPEQVFFIFHPSDRQLDSRITPESNTQKVPATFQDTGHTCILLLALLQSNPKIAKYQISLSHKTLLSSTHKSRENERCHNEYDQIRLCILKCNLKKKVIAKVSYEKSSRYNLTFKRLLKKT